eukprot:TRINITY_DN12425_c0_g1_i5.p1 TRINITY_DN12425_c0_g1~~TRINITY_DN12425_c0_g1_i5.p1  ORF type:complete len:273 (-),score=57.30 TRINITY_DN12425_c0_g1_i5:111-929(-)
MCIRDRYQRRVRGLAVWPMEVAREYAWKAVFENYEAVLPLCGMTSGVGRCVDYQIRMLINPINLSAFLGLLVWDLKWRFPLYMLIPYMFGRLLTAVATGPWMQVCLATPSLALGYLWGHLTFCEHRVRDAGVLACFMGVLTGISAAMRHWCPEAWPVDVAMDFVQLPVCTVAVCLSFWSLYKNRAWIWLAGLVWGMGGPIIISMLGQHPYLPLDPKLATDPVLLTLGVPMNGPVLWYSDQAITLPLVFVGTLSLAMKGSPAMVKARTKDKAQ